MHQIPRVASFFLLGLLAACAATVKPKPSVAAEPIPTQVAPPPAPVAPAPVVEAAPPPPPLSLEKEELFIVQTEKSSGMPAAEIRAWLAQARYQQSIINAITRPAEGKPWKDYRPIFLTQQRIDQGRSRTPPDSESWTNWPSMR